jgi:hypothetical protein
MSAKGFVLAEEGHVVQALAPVDCNGGKSSDIWSMANYSHASIVLLLGVTGGATTVTVEECDDFTPSNSTAIAFSYYAETTAAGDTLGARTAATTAGFAASTNDGVFYVIEIDASQLTDGYPNLRVVLSDPSGATFGSITAFLSGSRYGEEQSATAIA